VPYASDRSAPPRGGRRAAAVLAAALAVAALTATGCSAGATAQNQAIGNGQNYVSGDGGTTVYPVKSGPVAPRVTGTSLAGTRLSLAAYRGHVVVLNFWGSWCPPCRAEAPAMAALARRFEPAGVRFVGVDIRDEPAQAQSFMQDFGITYPSFSDPGGLIAADFRDTAPVADTPTTLVIGRSGRIVARVMGGVTQAGLAHLISRAGTAA
jgi:thiol-disulfide isomerase/thioredoxin